MSTEVTLDQTARRDAFQQLGTDVSMSSSAREAMDTAGLTGWDVRKHELKTAEIMSADGPMIQLDVPGRFASIRTNPVTSQPEVLGVVGNSYVPIQNETHCSIIDAIVDRSGASFDSAGSMRGGRDVFISMKLDEQLIIGGIDPVDLYVGAFNSHDGTSAFKIGVFQVRVFCANQQAALMKGNERSFTARHTAKAATIEADARHALGIASRYNEAFGEKAEELISKKMTNAEFNKMIEGFWELPETPAKAVATRHANRAATLNYLFNEAETNANIRGTRWAAYQSITEYVDHYAPTNLGGAESIESARATRVLTGKTALDVKNFAFQTLVHA